MLLTSRGGLGGQSGLGGLAGMEVWVVRGSWVVWVVALRTKCWV